MSRRWLSLCVDEEEPAQQSASERAVLIALYQSTDGANWNYNTNWLSDRPIGEWHNVTTAEAGRVRKLRFFDDNLSGVKPTELGNLSDLFILEFSSNDLSADDYAAHISFSP